MVVNYPLSITEETAIRWAVRIVPVVAMAVVLLLAAITMVSAQA